MDDDDHGSKKKTLKKKKKNSLKKKDDDEGDDAESVPKIKSSSNTLNGKLEHLFDRRLNEVRGRRVATEEGRVMEEG